MGIVQYFMILYIQGGRKLANLMMRTNMDVVHMLQVFVFWAICLIGISTGRISTNGEYAVGKFGILMPKVRPYRVSTLYMFTLMIN